MDINNLIENVRAFFIEQYKGVEGSNSFLSFEPLGSMIDPDDFKDENDQISDIKATEQLSILGDRLPQIDDVFLTNTSRLSSVYEELIESATFTGNKISAEDKTPYIGKFSEVKKESLFKFNESKKASITTPEGSYMPVYGFPKKWFDPQSSFWVGKSFSEKEDKDQPPKPPPTIKIKPMHLTWRTKLMANPEVVKAVETHDHRKKLTIPLLKADVAAAQPVQPGGTGRFARAVRSPLAAGRAAVRARPDIHVVPAEDRTARPAVMEFKNLNVLKRISVADRIKLTSHIIQNEVAPVEPVRSNEFTMSFDYCMVYLERPWFNTSIFHYSNLWYCLSLKEAYFSTGAKDEQNTGVLKCVPTAMILIKNLKIKAAWTDDDKKNAQSSIGLGVFNLKDSTFINNELVTPGMQIIGWICEVLPKLPVSSDPNLNA